MTTLFSARPQSALRARRSAGFTLIEIMVVLVILGVLASLVVPNLFGQASAARQQAAALDIKTIEDALERYRLQNFNYPSTQQGIEALLSKPTGSPEARNWAGPYLNDMPKDPWGNEYVYLSPGVNGDVDILSYGRDNQPGGEGEDADVTNWESDNG